jgi:valyl-tRNA synthetase
MPFDQKVSYLVENLKILPNELAGQGVEILLQAGETEYAVVLARDKGMIERAIQILVDAGDYLWAALIAKNAGLEEEAKRLQKEIAKVDKEILFVNKKLSNEQFVSKAPADVVQTEKEKARDYQAVRSKLEESLKKVEDALK